MNDSRTISAPQRSHGRLAWPYACNDRSKYPLAPPTYPSGGWGQRTQHLAVARVVHLGGQVGLHVLRAGGGARREPLGDLLQRPAVHGRFSPITHVNTPLDARTNHLFSPARRAHVIREPVTHGNTRSVGIPPGTGSRRCTTSGPGLRVQLCGRVRVTVDPADVPAPSRADARRTHPSRSGGPCHWRRDEARSDGRAAPRPRRRPEPTSARRSPRKRAWVRSGMLR